MTKQMAHKALPLAYTPERPIYEDEIDGLTLGQWVKAALLGFGLFCVLVVVLFALSLA